MTVAEQLQLVVLSRQNEEPSVIPTNCSMHATCMHAETVVTEYKLFLALPM